MNARAGIAAACRRAAVALLLLLPLAGAWTLGGCGGTGPVPFDLAWPAAPAPPMIRYTGSIDGSDDLERSFFGHLKDFLFGKAPDRFIGKPWGLAWDEDGRLYLADTARKGILILDFAAGSTEVIESLGAHGRLVEPVNLVRSGSGELYVADTGLNRVVVFDRDGEFVRFLGEGRLTSPVGLAWSTDGERLYVTDAARHELLVFSPSGELLDVIGGRGDRQGQFYHPLGVVVGPDDTVYVVDSFHFAVQAFDADGEFAFSFGSTAERMGSLARPRSIAIDSDGHLYVTDALKHNVQVFDPSGSLLLEFGSRGNGPGQFRLPAGVCVTADDRILVADSVNKRIQEFRYLAPGRGIGES